MATKKIVKKSEPKKKKAKAEKKPVEKAPVEAVKEVIAKEEKPVEKYFYAVGKRKTSIAQVKLYPAKSKENSIEINQRDLGVYFSLERLRNAAKAPLNVANGKIFFISANVCGGGITGQAEAIRLGISRALIKFDESLRKPLKDLGFLTRDARIVERKKPGKRKARRSPQWAKR